MPRSGRVGHLAKPVVTDQLLGVLSSGCTGDERSSPASERARGGPSTSCSSTISRRDLLRTARFSRRSRRISLRRARALALKHLMERECALILLDVNMPVMDGFETASLIHQHPR